MILITSALLAAVNLSAPAWGDESAPRNAYVEKVPGTNVSFEMLPVQGGQFQMGSMAPDRKGNSDEGPIRVVGVSPFWIGKFEVTWELYDLYAFGGEELDAISSPTMPYVDPTWGFGHQGYPAIGITHYAAYEFCRWLSAKTGREYRLPTEAEWEYAARAGGQADYFFGSDPMKLDLYAWFFGNSGGQTHPVGGKLPNPWGIFDIYGNVSEWVQDAYAQYPSQAQVPVEQDPVTGPTDIADAGFSYVTRGGSWKHPAMDLRSARRLPSDISWSKRDPNFPKSIWWHTDAQHVGFRLTRRR